MYIQTYSFYVPSVDSAKQIFQRALGLTNYELKPNDNSVAFKLGKTTLYCWVYKEGEKMLPGRTNSLDLVMDTKTIAEAYKILKNDKRFKTHYKHFGESKEYLMLSIYTERHTSFIHISDYDSSTKAHYVHT